MAARWAAAAEGMRPIAELMFVGLLRGVHGSDLQPHCEEASTMSGGAVRLPLVIMTAIGGGYNDAGAAFAVPVRPVRATCPA